MKTVTLVSLAMSLGLTNAQVRFCDANRRPNWEDCQFPIVHLFNCCMTAPANHSIPPGDSLMADFGMQCSTEIAHINGELDPAPSCMHWWWIDGNCLVTHCFQEEPNDGEGDPRSLTLGQVHQLYEPIQSRCSVLRAGGEFTGNFEFVNVFNDEGGDGGPSKRDIEVKRALFQSLKGESLPNGMMKGHSSLAEYLEWRNDTASAAERMASDILDQGDLGLRELAKRQNENDDYFQIQFEALGIRHPTDFERGPRLSSGVAYTWETSETQTFSVTTSVSMGASWNIFTASVGVEMTESESFTVTEGLTFDVDCPNQGQITFYPLYDYYEVISHPSETTVEIWIPVLSSDRKVNGEIAVACLG